MMGKLRIDRSTLRDMREIEDTLAALTGRPFETAGPLGMLAGDCDAAAVTDTDLWHFVRRVKRGLGILAEQKQEQTE